MKFKLMVLLLIIANNLTAQSKKENLDAYFSSLFKNGQFNGNVLIAQEGQILYERSFGLADLSTQREITNESSFPIASITKTFTATAILQLKQQGRLELQDKVSKFLPDFPYPKVTIKKLLSHTAGLPIYDSLFYLFIPKHPDTVFTNKDLIPAFLSSKAPLIFKSGEDFSYNNVNYNILALVIEKLSGLSYGAYLNEYIFKPSGMKNTSLSNFFSREDKNLSKRYNYKYPYSENLQLVDTAAEFKIINSFNFQGHGDLISTTKDLLKYDIALSNGSLLNNAISKDAYTPIKLTNGQDNIQRYALGWITNADTSIGEIVKHDGGLPGGRTMLLRNLSRRQTIILFNNNANNVVPIADKALRILNELNVEKPRKSAARIYAVALSKSGVEVSNTVLSSIKSDTPNYYLSEDEINSFGYAFLSNNRAVEAEAVFKKNVELFPLNWNTYDSYGEVLMKYGKKKEAFKMYQKSVDLNPNNENGREVLAAISVINVKFNSAGVTLEGTIYKPERFEAALVLVHGSGQEKRMNDLASLLAKNGIAVLTYDKRGVGNSGGVYAGPEVGTNNVDAANLNLLALDASAAANELSKNLKAKRVPLGLMGFSQAAWVIPLAAKKNLKVEFMALFSAPVATTLEQLRFQFYTNGNSKFWETHTEAEAREHISNDPDKYQFAATDPLASLNSLSIPGLWLYGGKDIQAPVGISIERLALLKVKGKQYEYQLFPQLGHNTGSSKSKEPMEFTIQWIKNRNKL
jgi:CubicO group peptidase (beta-lactamase class C family)/pimeloyl-ACP methyl ester carboxylesterase